MPKIYNPGDKVDGPQEFKEEEHSSNGTQTDHMKKHCGLVNESQQRVPVCSATRPDLQKNLAILIPDKKETAIPYKFIRSIKKQDDPDCSAGQGVRVAWCSNLCLHVLPGNSAAAMVESGEARTGA